MEVANLTATIDPEILNFIESLVNPESLPGVLKDLAAMDQDELLSLYLSNELESWVNERLSRKSEVVIPAITPDPELTPEKKKKNEEVTIETVKKYIGIRYNRYLEYSAFQCKMNSLHDQAGDLLNEVLIMVLLKDENKLILLYNKRKPKEQYRDLDFYILALLKQNAHSLTSPYRWKYRTLLRDSNASDILLGEDEYSDEYSTQDQQDYDSFLNEDSEQNPNEPEAEEYQDDDPTELISLKFQVIREILDNSNLSKLEIDVFKYRFFLDGTWKEWTGKQKGKVLTGIYKTVKEYVISEVEKQREKNNLETIHSLFLKIKYMPVLFSESEFLLIREYLSRERSLLSDMIETLPETGDQSEQTRLKELWGKQKIVSAMEVKLLRSMETSLSDNDIHFKF